MNLRGYLKLAQAPFQTMLAYRAATLFWGLEVLLRVYLMRFFWTAVYGGGGAVEGITLPMMITYATLSSVQGLVTSSDVQWRMQHKVRDGSIVIDLIRPYGFLRSLAASNAGESLLWRGPMALLILAASLLFVNLQPPASLTAGAGYLASLALAMGVGSLLSTLVSLFAFWTLELYGFNAIFDFLSLFLSGGLVPLWFLPVWTRRVAEWLPFQSLAHLPLSIYIGKVKGAAVWTALLTQVAWIVALSVLAWLLWKAAERKVIVQGG
ncbi:MAG: ABC-2 family transporter protein [Chloroflexota bacterium]|nr:ABC-2 family transporter protein [Chloroflexota bacterium]